MVRVKVVLQIGYKCTLNRLQLTKFGNKTVSKVIVYKIELG